MRTDSPTLPVVTSPSWIVVRHPERITVEIVHHLADGTTSACVADFDVFLSEGSDPDACPWCAAATGGTRSDVAPAVFSFAVPVLSYGLAPDGLVTPTAAVWTFDDSTYRRIVELAKHDDDFAKRALFVSRLGRVLPGDVLAPEALDRADEVWAEAIPDDLDLAAFIVPAS